MIVKNNLLVNKMDVAGWTQCGSSSERGKGLRERWDSKELWKSVEKATGEGSRPSR